MNKGRTPSTTGRVIPPPPVTLIDTRRNTSSLLESQQHLLLADQLTALITPELNIVWASHVPHAYHPALWVRLERLWVSTGSGGSWEEWGGRLVLSAGGTPRAPEWAAQVRYAMGHLLAYALLFSAPIRPPRSDMSPTAPLVHDPSPLITLRYSWLLDLGHSQPGDEERVKRAVAEELILAWGLSKPTAGAVRSPGTRSRPVS
jgi:hypothetical protein